MTDDIDIEGLREFARAEAIEQIRKPAYDQVFALETIGNLLFDISESLRTLVALLGSTASSTLLSNAAPTAAEVALLMRAVQTEQTADDARSEQH